MKYVVHVFVSGALIPVRTYTGFDGKHNAEHHADKLRGRIRDNGATHKVYVASQKSYDAGVYRGGQEMTS